MLTDFGWGRPDRMRALLTAYDAAGGPARLAGPEDASTVVAQLGHITEIGCRRWLASTTDADRAHHEAWVREYLDEPLTRRAIEVMLAAAGL